LVNPLLAESSRLTPVDNVNAIRHGRAGPSESAVFPPRKKIALNKVSHRYSEVKVQSTAQEALRATLLARRAALAGRLAGLLRRRAALLGWRWRGLKGGVPVAATASLLHAMGLGRQAVALVLKVVIEGRLGGRSRRKKGWRR